MNTAIQPPVLETRPRRRYDNSRRSGAARETRRRIVEAAAECFAETGFDATSVRSIAERAATSPETIYTHFGSKIGVLQAWIDHAVTGDDDDTALRDRAEIASLFVRDDLDASLREFVRIGRQINERVAIPIQVARTAAASSAELAALLVENERRRQDDFATAIMRLSIEAPLPNGLTTDRAAQLVAALCSVDLYRTLVLEAGWAPAEYEAQVVRLLESALELDSTRRPDASSCAKDSSSLEGYAADVAWISPGFVHPDRVELATGHHLRPIRATDVDIDYPAVMGSRESLWAKYGEPWGWPPSTMTFEQDRDDLARHEREIAAHETFNYAVLDADETELLGCVYIDPPADDSPAGTDAISSWWVVDAHVGGALDTALAEFVPRWLADVWGFSSVHLSES